MFLKSFEHMNSPTNFGYAILSLSRDLQIPQSIDGDWLSRDGWELTALLGEHSLVIICLYVLYF